MPKEKIENLITTLHDSFGDDLTSPQQAQLMQSMKEHLHDWDTPEPADPGLMETAELLLDDVEEQHPQAAAILKEVMEILGNIGV